MIDLSQREIILSYKGALTYDVIGDLIASLKEKMKLKKIRFGLYKKILTVMIEALENIIRYRAHFNKHGSVLDKFSPEFVISFYNDQVFIETVNPVFFDDVERLHSKLNYLNGLSVEELRELYKETITDGKFSEKGGAGLGIIEMSKIADEKLIYNFKSIDENISLFSLSVIINSNSSAE